MNAPADDAAPMLDALVVGGGVAGLWALARLTTAGHDAALLERDALGCRQTLASQGMVHGGLKYALRGQLTGASEAISAMPDRWRACLAGRGEVDLQGLAPLSEHYYLFARASTLGRLTSFFASKTLRGRIDKLSPANYPESFRHPGFEGVVYQLNDFVLHTPTLLEHLRAPRAARIYQGALTGDAIELAEDAVTVRLDGQTLRARRLILTAGSGTGPLLEALGVAQPRMQRRPLHQILVRAPDLPPLYAHCLTAVTRAEPRLTITSHREDDQWLWYLGGALATGGVERSEAEQADFAAQELRACVPWLDWARARYTSLRIDRAEPEQVSSQRPDEAFVSAVGPVLIGWPTKLSLVPDLGDRLMAAMPAPARAGAVAGSALPLPAAAVAAEPWL
ncbi:MAG: FAD-dependent oxidoreductase [Pseudomonadota bacterium]